MAPEDSFRSLRDGPDVGHLGRRLHLVVAFLQVVEDFAEPEDAHGDGDEVQAVGEGEAAEGEPSIPR